MTNVEIYSNNILIADFMALSKTIRTRQRYVTLYSKNGLPPNCEANELKYHSSWDWLISVVEKIEENATVTITQRSCIIDNEILIVAAYKIQAVFHAVARYIRRYNIEHGIISRVERFEKGIDALIEGLNGK